METQIDKLDTISTHVFILPFKSSESIEENINIWSKCKLEDKFFTTENFKKNINSSSEKTESTHISILKRLKKYAYEQYFNESAKKVLEDKCSLYERKDLIDKKITIKAKIGKSQFKDFELNIEKVLLYKYDIIDLNNKTYFLKIYLTYRLANSVEEAEELLKNINLINEHFRRVYFEFLSVNDDKNCSNEPIYECELNAEKITLNIEKDNSICQENVYKNNDDVFKKEISKVIDYIITGNKDSSKDNAIIPFLDDRMYTCCVITNNTINNYIKDVCYNLYKDNKDIIDESNHQEENNCVSFLSKLAMIHCLVDIEKSNSSPGPEYLINAIKKFLYSRWSGKQYSTNHFIGRYSYICVTSSTDNGSDFINAAVLPPINFYSDFSMLVLLQKIYIQLLGEKLIKIKNSIILPTKLNSLYKGFLDYLSIYNLHEITVQEQGIDIYEMMMNSFDIEKKKEWLTTQIETINNEKNNYIGLLIGVIGLIVALPSVFPKSFENCELLNFSGFDICLFSNIILLLLFVLFIGMFKRK